MKKFLSLSMAAVMALSLAACGGSGDGATSGSTATNATAEGAASAEITGIAQVCDVGTIDDESFNQGCWTAVEAYGEANGIEVNYYLPPSDEANDEDRQTLIRNAVNDGANTVVCVGYLYGPSLAWAATEYPDVHFIAVDVTVADIGTETIPDNVYCITYKEEQAGYLAGYAAVKDGFTELGFLGGMAVPAVIRFGYGFIQGAEYAAQEMGVEVEMKYWYSYSFNPSDDIKNKAASWYTEGTEVIFSCGGGIYNSVVAAAEEGNGKVVGVDSDQAHVSETIITSAMKDLPNSVILALTRLYDNGGEWPEDMAGVTQNLGAADNCVGLPTAETSWRFNTFTVDEYNAIYEQVKSGEIAISNSIDELPATTAVTVDVQE